MGVEYRCLFLVRLEAFYHLFKGQLMMILHTGQLRQKFAIVLLGLGGRRFAVEACDILGYSRQEMLQRTVLDITHPDDRYADAGQLKSLSKGDADFYSMEKRFLHKDGRDVWVNLTVTMVRDVSGKPRWFVSVVEDITEKKQTEAEIQQVREEYIHIARVSAMGELTASLAHELKQPLAAIRSNAQAALRFLAVDKPDLDEFREILADIVEDDRRADMVIAKLRALMQKGKTETFKLNLNDVIQDTRPLINSYGIVKNISQTYELDARLLPISGDRIQLQQVLINLVLNSSEAFSAEEAVVRTITVSTRQHDAESVLVSVSDNGQGIPETVLGHLFEPFYTTKSKGLGMGLAICRSIVAEHGGRLWAENRPEGGAVFCFTIPVDKGLAP